MKKFISILTALAFTLTSVFAIDDVRSLSANSTTSIATSGIYLASVQIQNATGAAAVVRLIDAPSTTLTYTRGSFTLPLSYATNYVTTYTNINGVTTSVTNAAIFTTTQTIAATTNSYKTVQLLNVPANSTTTWTPVNGAYMIYGLTSTNDAAVTATFSYATIRP